jgi:hypothetical protein
MRGGVLAPILILSLFTTRMSSVIRSNSLIVLRLRGGLKDMAIADISRELDKMELETIERIEAVRAINVTVAERWEALQKRFNEEAQDLVSTGYVDPNVTEGDFLPEIVEMMHEEPMYMLTRRNYTKEHPFVNPCKKTREFMDWWSKRTLEEVQADFKAHTKRN